MSYLGFMDTGRPVETLIFIQGGANGSTTMTNLGTLGGSSAISVGAAFSSSHTADGHNMVLATRIIPASAAFSTQSFTEVTALQRPAGQDFTIECYFKPISVGAAAGMPAFRWTIIGVTNMVFTRLTPARDFQIQIGAGSLTTVATMTLGTLYFLQLTVIGDTYYFDIDGVQVATGTFPSESGIGSTASVFVASEGTTSSAGASWAATPFRMTSGALPRGGTSMPP